MQRIEIIPPPPKPKPRAKEPVVYDYHELHAELDQIKFRRGIRTAAPALAVIWIGFVLLILWLRPH